MKGMRLVVVLPLLISFGCATRYTPRPSPYIVRAETMRNPDFYREGRRIDLGFWGGGAEALVKGNPFAEERIRGYSGQRTATMVLLFLTEASLGTSLAFMTAGLSDHPDRFATGAALLPVGLLLAIPSLIYLHKAEDTLRDSVNLYNDGIERSRPCP